jgi:hypothetical protein
MTLKVSYPPFLLLISCTEESKEKAAKESESTDESLFQLQVDYLTAFLDFYSKSPRVAHTIARKYENYPILHWRAMFNEIAEQLKEIKDKEEVEQDDQQKNIVNLKVPLLSVPNIYLQSTLDFEISGSSIKVLYNNIKACHVCYYKMDIELLFSSSPFVQQVSFHLFLLKLSRSLETSHTSYPT